MSHGENSPVLRSVGRKMMLGRSACQSLVSKTSIQDDCCISYAI